MNIINNIFQKHFSKNQIWNEKISIMGWSFSWRLQKLADMSESVFVNEIIQKMNYSIYKNMIQYYSEIIFVKIKLLGIYAIKCIWFKLKSIPIIVIKDFLNNQICDKEMLL